MKILIASATTNEVEPFMLKHGLKSKLSQTFQAGNHAVTLLVTGVGMAATAFSLGEILAKEKFDFAFNVGIAGSFKNEFVIGSVVNVLRDRFGDLGAEDDEVFLDVFNLKLADANAFPFREGWIYNDSVLQSSVLNPLKYVRAITVNKVHGSDKSIVKIVTHYQPDIESMEGAAFCYACAMHRLPYMQIRAISNLVEKRNRENWNIPLAVKNLNDWLLLFLNELK